MKSFMIGQPGYFDDAKYVRDFRKDFYGIEALVFENESEIDKLIAISQRDNFNIGIHFPLRKWISKYRDPQFLSKDDVVRAESHKIMEDELEYLQKVKPKYVLFHYPKPVILDDRVDWSPWRFADSSEYVSESDFTFKELKEKSEYLFKWLSDKALQYNFIPVLELDALNKYVYETNMLEELLEKYQSVKLCLDTGRLNFQDRIDKNFDAIGVIKKFAKYAEVVHVCNTKVNGYLEKHHYPALPSLKPEEGWPPIEAYMRIIGQENKHAKFMFEHMSDLISDEELQGCYDWIDELIKIEKE
ncbi:MAG: hypothetical protein K0R80_784 [Clostridia bacterium]|nr:hypothetical protein [Clostridia bacterium]